MRATQREVEALRPAFETAHGIAFQCTFGAVGAMREKLLSGEPCDVIILIAQMIEALATTGIVTGDSPRALGRVLTGVAVPSSRSTFDSSSPDALRAALVGAAGIYLPDPERATAGIHFANVLKKLDALGVKTIVVGSPGAVDTRFFRPGQMMGTRSAQEAYNDNLAHLRDIDKKAIEPVVQKFWDVRQS